MLDKIDRKLSHFYNAKPHMLAGDTPIVSFTFDDVPLTSIDPGAQILKNHGATGTFYLSGGLAGQDNLDRPQYATSDIDRLLSDGHEIGCHTFGHVAAADVNGAGLANEFDRNLAFLAPRIGDQDLVSFSYPFGSTTLAAKRLVRQRFETGRGISPGLNSGKVDLSHLKANAIYSGQMTEEMITDLIQSAIAEKAWLIFYTHDISNDPTPYGCSPDLFEFAVQEAANADCQILSMREAMARVT
ncbi:MAG: polysaccharide deacetylase family protein [Hyphomonadaceae bacterium]